MCQGAPTFISFPCNLNMDVTHTPVALIYYSNRKTSSSDQESKQTQIYNVTKATGKEECSCHQNYNKAMVSFFSKTLTLARAKSLFWSFSFWESFQTFEISLKEAFHEVTFSILTSSQANSTSNRSTRQQYDTFLTYTMMMP